MQRISSFARTIIGLPARRNFSGLMGLICVMALVSLNFQQVTSKGMHHTLTWGTYQDSEGMAIAISDLVYHLNQGYLAYADVLRALDSRLGASNVPGDTSRIELARNGGHINNAIKAAMSLEQITIIAPMSALDFYPVVRRQLIPVYAEDVGRSDYYKLAFSLFGFEVESMHYLYFLMLLLSSLLFWAGFQRNVVAMGTLIASLTVLILLINSNLFSETLPSVSSYRGVSALALIPVIHLVLCLYYREPWKSPAGFTAILQTCILVFAIWSRASAQWAVLAVVLMAGFVWLRRIWSDHRPVILWPLVLVLGGVAILNLHARYAVHQVYFTEQLVAGHFFWHSAYIGLQKHPRWPFSEVGDDAPFRHAARYLAVTRPDINPTQAPITSSYWMGLHDAAVREVFIEFARENPRYMMELYAWWKPGDFVSFYVAAARPFLNVVSLLFFTLFVTAFGLGLFWRQGSWRGVIHPIMTVTGAVALASLAPLMWAYPAPHVMTDSIWAMTSFLWACAIGVLGLVYRLVASLKVNWASERAVGTLSRILAEKYRSKVPKRSSGR